MQKKIIASLLVSPMAVTAMANINVSNGVALGGWSAENGAVLSGIVTGNKVSIPVGVGPVVNSFTAPAPGTYKLAIGTLENCAFTVEGATNLETSESADAITFDVAAAGDVVTLKVTPGTSTKGYSFEQGATEIVFDFETAKNALQTAFEALPDWAELDPDDESEAAKALKAQMDAIDGADGAKAKIEADIAKVVASDDEDAEAAAQADINTYTQYELYADPNKIMAAINDLADEIGVLDDSTGKYTEDSINAQIEEENAIFNAAKVNAANKAKYEGEYEDLVDALAALTTAFNDADESETQPAVKDQYDKIVADVAAFGDAITETYKEENMNTPNLEFEPKDADGEDLTAEGITTAIDALKTKISTLEAQLQALKTFQAWYANESTVEKTYNTSRINIQSLQGLAPDYVTSFEAKKSAWISELSDQYTICQNTYKGITKASTADEIEAAKTAIEAAVDQMKSITSNAQELFNGKKATEDAEAVPGQNQLMEDALAAVANAQAALNGAPDPNDEDSKGGLAYGMDSTTLANFGVPAANITKFEAAVKAVQDAIDAVKDDCQTKYLDLELAASDYDTTAFADVTAAMTALESEINSLGLDQLQAAATAIGALNDQLNAFKETLTDYQEKTKGEEPGSEGIDFNNIFMGNIEGITAAIGDVDKDTYADLAPQIADQITAASDYAKTIFDAVTTTQQKAHDFTAALDTLDGYVATKKAALLEGGETTTFDIDAFEAAVAAEREISDDWNKQYSDLIKLAGNTATTGQDVYNAAQKLDKAMKDTDWESWMTEKFNALEDNGSEFNVEAVQALIDEVDKNSTDTAAKVSTEDFTKSLDDIKTALAAQKANQVKWGATAPAAGEGEEEGTTPAEGEEAGDATATDLVAAKAAACAAIDADLKTLYGQVGAVLASQEDYLELLPLLIGTVAEGDIDPTGGLAGAIKDDADYVTANFTNDDAAEFWNGKIGEDTDEATKDADDNLALDADSSLYAQLNTLKAMLDADLAAGTINKDSFKADINKVQTAATNLLTNMQAEVAALATLTTQLGNVMTAIQADVTYNTNSVSGDAAIEFWNGEIGTSDDEAAKDADGNLSVAAATTLYGQYATLQALLASYEAAGTVAANADSFKTNADDVTTDANNLLDAMKANETALYALLDKSQQVRNVINEYLAELNGTSTQEGVVNYDKNLEEVQKATAAMNALLTTDLSTVDGKVTVDYNKGKCGSNQTELEGEYDAIVDAAKKIIQDLNGEYAGLVEEANAEMVKDSGIVAAIASANADYTNAVGVFNAYKKLKNEGYLAYIAQQIEENPTSTNHEALYDYAMKIIELENAYEAAVATANGKMQIINPDDFKKDYLDVLATYVTEMKALADQIVNDYNGWGAGYYTELKGEVDANITAAEDALKSADITDEDKIAEVLSAPLAAQKSAEDAEAAAKTATTPNEQMGIVMNAIANTLDPYAGEDGIDLTSTADAAFTAAYDNFNTEKAKWDADVDGYKEFVDITEYTDAATAAETAVEAAKTAFNDPEVTPNKIEGLSAQLAAISKALSDLQTAYDQVSAEYTANVGNKDLKDTLLNKVNNTETGLEGLLAALKAWAAPMGCAYSVDYSSITNQIASITQEIEDKSKQADFKDYEDPINESIKNAQDAIAAMYNTVAADEVAYLNNLYNQAKNAYNSAREANKTESYGAQSAVINAVKAGIDKLNAQDLDEKYNIGTEEAPNEVAFEGAAVNYEQQLATVISYLQTQYDAAGLGEQTSSAILTELQGIVGTLQLAINEAEEGLEGYTAVEAEYLPQYQALDAELDKISNAINAAGDNLLAQGDNYKAQLADIQSQLDALNAEVAPKKAAAEAQKVSDERAVVLNGQQEALTTLLGEVKTALEGYGLLDTVINTDSTDTYGDKIEALEGDLEAMSTWINETMAGKLTATTEYNNAGVTTNSLNYAIKALRLNGGKAYAAGINAEAGTEITKVLTALATSEVLEEVKAQVETEAKALQTANNLRATAIADFNVTAFQSQVEGATVQEITDENYNKALGELAGFIEAIDGEKADAAELLEKLQNSEFVPGAVLGGTEVTAADIAQIVAWASEDMAVSDLIETEGATVAAAADLNGDKVINVTDVTMAIQIYLNAQDTEALSPTMLKLARYSAPAAEASFSMGVALESENNGVRRYAITLDNTVPVIAGQIDLKLPAGMRVVDAQTTDRDANHGVTFHDNGATTRVILYSMDNAAFESTTGAVVYVDVEGNGNIALGEATVVDSYLGAHRITAANTSFVDTIIDSAKEAGSRIYNAAGVMFNKLQKGINIIRDANGKTRKEINRK